MEQLRYVYSVEYGRFHDYEHYTKFFSTYESAMNMVWKYNRFFKFNKDWEYGSGWTAGWVKKHYWHNKDALKGFGVWLTLTTWQVRD